MKFNTVEYFIKKFKAIPESEIGKHSLDNKCALWHCGVRVVNGDYTQTEEATELIKLFGGENPRDYFAVYNVNDHGIDSPKNNILRELKSLRPKSKLRLFWEKLVLRKTGK